MSEKTGITETRQENGPKKFWNGALKMVKGDNSLQLMEQFTSEMTLVAEGLCEDQTRLRQDVDQMMTQEDRRLQKLESRIQLLESALEEERAAHDRDLTENRNRLAALEKKANQAEAQLNEGKKSRERKHSWIRDLTVLVGIAAGAWVIVTILNMIH